MNDETTVYLKYHCPACGSQVVEAGERWGVFGPVPEDCSRCGHHGVVIDKKVDL